MSRFHVVVLATAVLGPLVATQLKPNAAPQPVRKAGSSVPSLVNELRQRVHAVDGRLTEIRRSQNRSVAELKNKMLAEMRLALSDAVGKIIQSQQKTIAELRSDFLSETESLRKALNDLDLASPSAQPNATMERRQAVVSRLQRLLDDSNATNISVDVILSKIADCTEAKRIAKNFSVENQFRAVTTRDLDIVSAGEHIGEFPLKTCGEKCLQRGYSCYGFHVSAEDCCTLFTTAAASWNETETVNLTVWVVRRHCQKTCTAAAFPHTWGRSRYRIIAAEMQWPAARRACEESGGKLAQISSDSELRFVRQMLKKSNCVWVGLQQQRNATEPDRDWFWYPSQQRFDLHSHWESGEPNDHGGQDVGCIGVATGRFWDISRKYYAQSLCECLMI